MKVYLIWLICVIVWNFAVPNAAPIEDVVAILLLFLSIGLKKIIKQLSFCRKINILVIRYSF